MDVEKQLKEQNAGESEMFKKHLYEVFHRKARKSLKERMGMLLCDISTLKKVMVNMDVLSFVCGEFTPELPVTWFRNNVHPCNIC